MSGRFQNSDEVQKNEDSTLQKGQNSTKYVETQTEVCVEIVSARYCSSHLDHNASFSAFEKHTKGIGFKFLSNMGFDGRGVRIIGKWIAHPLEVK